MSACKFVSAEGRDTHKVAAHPDRLATPMEKDRANVDGRGKRKADDHGDGHERAKVVDDMDEREEAGEMEARDGDEGHVEAGEGVAVVEEGLVAKRGDGEAWGPRVGGLVSGTREREGGGPRERARVPFFQHQTHPSGPSRA